MFRDRRKSANIREKHGDRLVGSAQTERVRVFKQLFYHVFGHETAVICSCDLFASEAVVGLYSFDRYSRLRRDSTDQFQMVRRKSRKRIEPVSVQNTVNIRLRYQRRTDRRPDTLRNDRLGTLELLVSLCVLR